MLNEFIQKNLKTAKYKLLKDGGYFGSIPGIRGVWAHARNLESCRKELKEVLEEWVLLKVRNKEKVRGLDIRFDKRKLVHA